MALVSLQAQNNMDDTDTTDFIDVPENDTVKAVMAEVIESDVEKECVGEDDPIEEKAVKQLYICGVVTQPEAYFNQEPYEQAILQIIGGTAYFLDEVYYKGVQCSIQYNVLYFERVDIHD